MVIEEITSTVVTRYDGGYLHTPDVRATELQQALETDIYLCKHWSSLWSFV